MESVHDRTGSGSSSSGLRGSRDGWLLSVVGRLVSEGRGGKNEPERRFLLELNSSLRDVGGDATASLGCVNTILGHRVTLRANVNASYFLSRPRAGQFHVERGRTGETPPRDRTSVNGFLAAVENVRRVNEPNMNDFPSGAKHSKMSENVVKLCLFMGRPV